MRNIKFYIWGLFSLLSIVSVAQTEKAVIKLSQDSILMGDPIELTLIIPAENPKLCVFPDFVNDTLTADIDIISKKSIVFDQNKGLVSKTYVVSAYKDGRFKIPEQTVLYRNDNDTITYLSDDAILVVSPAFVIDTLPVDTIYADYSGVILFGRGNFESEIEQQIPDSVKRSMPEDSLNMLKDQIRQTLVNQFGGQVFRASGLRSEKDILQMVEAPQKRLFVINDKSIRETHRVPGAFDTVFVQEYDTVVPSQALFTSFDIQDIKEEYHKTNFNLKEFGFYVWRFIKANWWWILGAIFLLAVIVYYFWFYKKGRKVFNPREKVVEPAHVIAFRDLERIRNEKLWLKNQVKRYYTDLTDVFRHYLENRFELSAMEKTSAEILDSLNETNYLDDDLVMRLSAVLERSDFVKFARSMPLPDENERSLKDIYEIVDRTKPVDLEPEASQDNTEVEPANE